MKKLLLYSNHPTDHVAYEFDDNGQLRAFEINKRLDQQSFEKFRQFLPFQERELTDMVNNWKQMGIKCRLEEVYPDLTFDRFYMEYHKAGGEKRNRVRAERLWSKLKDAEKGKAIRYIRIYVAQTQNAGIAMKYPDTYLKNNTWND